MPDNRLAVMPCSEYCVCMPIRSWMIIHPIIEHMDWNCGCRRDRRRGVVPLSGRSRNDGPPRRTRCELADADGSIGIEGRPDTQWGLVQVEVDEGERGRAEDDPGEDRGCVAHDVCTSSVTGREIRADFTLLFRDFEWDIHVVVHEYLKGTIERCSHGHISSLRDLRSASPETIHG